MAGTTTLNRVGTAGPSTREKVRAGGLRLGARVLVRLDEAIYRPGEIIQITESPQAPDQVIIRIASFLDDHLTPAVREDRHGCFYSTLRGETLWCQGAPRGSAIGEWELL